MRSITISSSIFFIVSFVVFMTFKYVSISKRNCNNLNFKRELFKVAGVAYGLRVISLVFFPITLEFGEHIYNRLPVIWINPMTSLVNIIGDNHLDGIIYNIGGNFILLAPLPIFLIYFFRDKVDNLKSMFFICFFIAISIESLQFFESLLIPAVRRFIETNDVILNTSGGVAGYLVYDKLIRPYSYLFRSGKSNSVDM